MEPKLKDFSEDSDILRFTLHGVEVSVANALRRTVLSDIPIVVIETDSHEKNQCHIKTNTGRLHNEILKQRLSCIPIHSTLLRDSEDKKALPGNQGQNLRTPLSTLVPRSPENVDTLSFRCRARPV